MKKILITAYAVNPYKGSEDGTGWNMIKQIAKNNKVIAISRENNRPDIEKYLKTAKGYEKENIQFHYYDLPKWARFWKKGAKGSQLYFYLWQLTIPMFVRKLKIPFDIAHSLNFHSDSHPNFLWLLDKPVVWGPIGHHPKMPAKFLLPFHGVKELAIDRFKWVVKTAVRALDPFYRMSVKNSSKIIGVNKQVQKVIHANETKVVHMPAVACAFRAPDFTIKKDYTVISIGRFAAMKGFDVTIKSFAEFISRVPHLSKRKCKLVLVGKGPEKQKLVNLVNQLGITDNVVFYDWMAQSVLMDLYKSASVFLFPSHEGAGMVVPEALSFGLPVLCFDNAGPGEFVDKSCGIKVSYDESYKGAIKCFADGLYKLMVSEITRIELSEGAYKHFIENFQWEKKGDIIENIYKKVI